MNISRHDLTHRAFQAGVVLKGLDGLVEFIIGLSLLSVSKPELQRLVRMITRDELSEDPDDLLANLLKHASRHLSTQTQHFASFYLLGHGTIKLGLAIGLLCGARWSYPSALVVLTLFVAYQIYRIMHTHSIVLSLLTVLDAAIVLLIYWEWRHVRSAT